MPDEIQANMTSIAETKANVSIILFIPILFFIPATSVQMMLLTLYSGDSRKIKMKRESLKIENLDDFLKNATNQCFLVLSSLQIHLFEKKTLRKL